MASSWRTCRTCASLNVLPRQLPAEFMEVADRFKTATSGYAQAVVDSNRGVLLGLYVERPTLMERIELGELIGYIIIVVGAAGCAGVRRSSSSAW